MSKHGQRGQVLPVWAMGIVAMLIVTMAVVRYSDMVRWQVRAQNAADAAAQAIVALQTQQFNEMGQPNRIHPGQSIDIWLGSHKPARPTDSIPAAAPTTN